jgi:hypothetical protein
MRDRLRSSIAACSLLLATPLMLGSTDQSSNLSARALASHNRERAGLGIPALQWDEGLARSAQGWADKLAASGEFEHAPENMAAPEGENLWAGSTGYFSIEVMVDAWIREKHHFKPGRFPANSTTGSVADVGHYTQVVWARTRRVGCALQQGQRDDVFVCRYSQAGNYAGESPF